MQRFSILSDLRAVGTATT